MLLGEVNLLGNYMAFVTVRVVAPGPAEKVQEKGHVPAMRGGREEEMGLTALYLAKNEYVNGQIITVDGGVMNVIAGAA